METYTIRELSERFGLPASTLRYYEDLGLLQNVTHTAQQKRIYTLEHVNRLTAIECFKQTGLPLQKMLLFFEYEKDLPAHIDDIIKLVTDQEEDIKAQMESLQQGLLHIQDKVRFYTGIREAINQDKPWPTWEETLRTRPDGIE